jgi:hypothetical protein
VTARQSDVLDGADRVAIDIAVNSISAVISSSSFVCGSTSLLKRLTADLLDFRLQPVTNSAAELFTG